MKKFIPIVITGLFIFFFFAAPAQTKAITISGKVISFEESFALEGVSITVKGTNKNSGTQADGTFSIGIAPEDKILVFSLSGYQTQELAITDRRDYEIVLRRNGSGDASIVTTRENKIAPPFRNYRLQKNKVESDLMF